MTTNTYGGYTVDQLREFIAHTFDTEHGGDTIDELTGDTAASANIVRDLLDAIEPQQDGDLLRPVARWVYNAVRVNLDLLHGICMEHGCQPGDDVALWLRDYLSNEKSPAPEQASEAVNQRPGMTAAFVEVVPTAEDILDARAAGGNGTSSKVEIVWSRDGETYSEDCLEALLDTHSDLTVGDVVHFGEKESIKPHQLIDADDVIDLIGDRAYEVAGEFADGYPLDTVKDEAKAELNALLAAWIEKHAKPTFYLVEKSREHVITTEDMEGREQ
ncbi:hypothetical protein ACTXHA_28625 [Burkholderia cenocepacia]